MPPRVQVKQINLENFGLAEDEIMKTLPWLKEKPKQISIIQVKGLLFGSAGAHTRPNRLSICNI